MRETNPIRMLAQIVSLAMVALALMIGSALAHGGHASTETQAAPQTQATTQSEAKDAERQASEAGPGNLGDVPCSDDHRNTGSASGTCCTIACHAALAAPAIEPPAAHEPPSVRIAGLTDRLEGRSSDRAERPPRLS